MILNLTLEQANHQTTNSLKNLVIATKISIFALQNMKRYVKNGKY